MQLSRGILQTANSKPLRRKREEYLLPASLVQPEPETMEGSNGLTTFDNLQGFLQLYDNKLEVQNETIYPDLLMSQPEVETERSPILKQ